MPPCTAQHLSCIVMFPYGTIHSSHILNKTQIQLDTLNGLITINENIVCVHGDCIQITPPVKYINYKTTHTMNSDILTFL